ncbi:MAG: DUF1642 domain-containing protein [Lactococcus lactis]
MTKFEEEFEHELDYFIERELSLDEKLSFGARDVLVKFFSGWHSPEHIEKEIQMKLLKLQQQALPVVPADVAKLPPFDGMKEYVLDERLLTIREYLNKLDGKSNSDITEAETWCMIHEDIVYSAMLNGYKVEKPALFEVKMPIIYWDDDASQLTNGFDFLRIDKETDEVDFVGFLSNTKKHTVHFTEQEIKSIDERYWQFAVPVEDNK